MTMSPTTAPSTVPRGPLSYPHAFHCDSGSYSPAKTMLANSSAILPQLEQLSGQSLEDRRRGQIQVDQSLTREEATPVLTLPITLSRYLPPAARP